MLLSVQSELSELARRLRAKNELLSIKEQDLALKEKQMHLTTKEQEQQQEEVAKMVASELERKENEWKKDASTIIERYDDSLATMARENKRLQNSIRDLVNINRQQRDQIKDLQTSESEKDQKINDLQRQLKQSRERNEWLKKSLAASVPVSANLMESKISMSSSLLGKKRDFSNSKGSGSAFEQARQLLLLTKSQTPGQTVGTQTEAELDEHIFSYGNRRVLPLGSDSEKIDGAMMGYADEDHDCSEIRVVKDSSIERLLQMQSEWSHTLFKGILSTFEPLVAVPEKALNPTATFDEGFTRRPQPHRKLVELFLSFVLNYLKRATVDGSQRRAIADAAYHVYLQYGTPVDLINVDDAEDMSLRNLVGGGYREADSFGQQQQSGEGEQLYSPLDHGGYGGIPATSSELDYGWRRDAKCWVLLTLIILSGTLRIDILQSVLDALLMELSNVQVHSAFAECRGIEVVHLFLRCADDDRSDLAFLASAILMNMCSEDITLKSMIAQCSRQSFLDSAAIALANTYNSRMLENVSIVLQKLSRIP
ncbi:hypothetical protein HK102_000055 [Quaeritorhiza haematococci]|nr:hypothetical protein HK102_000055 [Quaeritorhiza haematococci]